MKDYAAQGIRNVCLLSHGGSGKTTLVECMLFHSGALDRLGKVEDGTTTTDFDPEEIKRKSSISTAMAPCEWKNHKINFIDTPGYFDFVGEVKQGVRVADSALILVPAKGGVLVGAEKSWMYAKERKIPVMFYVSRMDEENADFFSTLKELTTIFGKAVLPFTLPIIEEEKFVGWVDLIHRKAKKLQNNKMMDTSIPESLSSAIEEVENNLYEAIAENDEGLMEKYFNGEKFTQQEIEKGIKNGILAGSIVPVFCGSALSNCGVDMLMDAIVQYMPSPADTPIIKGQNPASEETIELETSKDAPVSAFVFKTIADAFVGKISMFRVCSGTLKTDAMLLNATTGKNEKMAHIFVLKGKKHIPVESLSAGDIGAVAKLQTTNTNDTLCDPSKPVVLDKINFPEPAVSLAVNPKSKGDEEKIGAGLHKLQDEDLTFKVEINTETHQTLISGIGEQHLDVIVNKLKSRYGVSVDLSDPKVPYRETIKKKVKAEGKHKKQSGGHGQYGHVWIEFEPGEQEALTFEEKIFGGAVPKQYFPAVEKGLHESIQKGVLAGYPVVYLKATLVDGSYHPVDSSEMAFKIASHLAYKKGLAQASTVLLEPIAHVEVDIPESYMGDIIGDLNKRRGRILGMDPKENGIQQVIAEVPQAEMFKYATDLRSMTHGRGNFRMKFERYEEAPPMVSEKVVAEAKKAIAEEEHHN